MIYLDIALLLALVQFIVFGAAVGRARARYNCPAPAMSGNEIFERYLRVQMNTLELLVCLVPAAWLFARYVDANWAAGLVGLYLIGRLVYFRSYVRDPKSRALGFGLSSFPIIVMIGGAGIGAVLQLLRG